MEPAQELNQLARKALAESNSATAATEQLYHWICERDDLTDLVRRRVAHELIDYSIRRYRHEIESGSHEERVEAAAQQMERSSSRLRGVVRSWYDWPLPGSRMPLREATKADLVSGAEESERNAKSNAIKAAFQRAVAQKLRGGDRVSDRLSEEQIDALWRKCETS